MRIGPESWRAVDINAAGVPRGPKFGAVDWFAERAGRHGLKLCWSRLWHGFAVYTQPAPSKFVVQFPCWKPMSHTPIPLTPELLSMLLFLWRKSATETQDTIMRRLAENNRNVQEKAQRERAALMYDVAKDAQRSWSLKRGYATPRVYLTVPKLRTG